MPALKPWYHVVTPREDLREGRPMDASEFAVHLDHVRDGRAPEDYQEPARFFERTYPDAEPARPVERGRPAALGGHTETSAVFNMATQFGGGKTHSLTLLYHLARRAPARRLAGRCSGSWTRRRRAVGAQGGDGGLRRHRVRLDHRPRRATTARRVRKTPWGEIAWQLGGERGCRGRRQSGRGLRRAAT